MNNNKIIIFIAIIALILIIGVPTILKVRERHNDALYNALDNQIIEAAKKCVNDNKCKEDENIYLKDLYKNKYLKKLVDPITDEYIKESTYVDPMDYKIYYD